MIALNQNIKQMSSTNMPMGNLISYQGTGVNKLAIQKVITTENFMYFKIINLYSCEWNIVLSLTATGTDSQGLFKSNDCIIQHNFGRHNLNEKKT